MDLQRACTLLLGVVLLGTNLAVRASEVSPRLLDQGQAQLRGGERLSIPIPDTAENLLFRFSEHAIDLRLHWTIDGQPRQANAAGRRLGEQVLWMAADQGHPDRLVLQPVLTDAPPGDVHWSLESWPRASANPLLQALRLESNAAEWADQDDSEWSESALLAYLEAARILEQLGSSRVAEVLYRAGQLQSRQRRWGEAESSHRSALSLSPEPELAARHEQALAYALMKQSHHDEALHWFDRAIAHAEASGATYDLALNTNNRCLVLHAQGDMTAAVPCFARAEAAYARAGIEGYRSVVLVNQGAALTNLGRLEEAESAFSRALQFVSQLPDEEEIRMRAAIALHQAWSAIAAGRFGVAMEQGLNGQSLVRGSDRYFELWGQLIRATASAMAAVGQVQRAREQIDALLASPALLAVVTDPARLRFAAAQLVEDPEQRLRALTEVMSVAEATADDSTYLRAWLEQADVWLEQGRSEQARTAAQGSLAMARLRGIADVEVSALMLLADMATPDEAIELNSAALQIANAGNRIEDRFVLLHARSRLHQQLASWEQARSAVLEADRAYEQLRIELSSEEITSLRRRLQPLASGSLAAGLLDPALSVEQRADWTWERLNGSRYWGMPPHSEHRPYALPKLHDSLLPHLSRPLHAVDRQLRQEQLRLSEERLDRRTPDQGIAGWRQLQASLGPEESLLVVLADDPVSALMLVTVDGVEVRNLGPGSKLEETLRHVLRGLGRQDPLGEGALRARLAYLAELLCVSELGVVGSKLNYLPGPGMEALPWELVLGEGAPRMVRLSAETLAPAGSLDELGLATSSALILEPDPQLQTTNADLARLPATREEVASLIAMMPGRSSVRRLSGHEAAASLQVGYAGAALGLVHVAGHTDPHPSWTARDALAFGHGADARVELGQLRRQRWPAELVVLSACKTALGGDGELALGFAQGFLQAGARQVIASSWPVDDLGSAQFMGHFYRELLIENQAPEAALANAQLRMRTDPRWSAPYWWAGYQLWRPTPGPDSPDVVVARQD